MMKVQPNVVLAADTGKVSYNVPITYPKGVYVQHIDRTLYTEEEWTAKGFGDDVYNGIAVVTDNAKFVVAKYELGSMMTWLSKTSTLVDGILTTNDKEVAKKDYAGHHNTQLMLATDTSKAGYSCANYEFRNGAKGYLPAAGELYECYKNRATINSIISKIGGQTIDNIALWSSTQADSNNAFCVYFFNGNVYSKAKEEVIHVRPFTTL